MLFLLAVAAYILGSIPVAYLIARWTRGIDLRKYGSGNVGSSNVMQATSKRWTIPVAAYDLGKGILAVWLARWAGLDVGPQFMVGLAAVVGHNWPIFLGFRGGRGILTSLGVILAFSPLLGITVLVMSFSLAPFKKLSLGVFIALLSLPVLSYFFSEFFNIDEPVAVSVGLGAVTIMALGRRLIGRRSGLSTKLSNRELMFNRLLFDRDIRNRQIWLSRSENTGNKALS
ncbi:MAG: glycerol-3-phosphate acyltransferase [Dehalogenimonas sp.]